MESSNSSTDTAATQAAPSGQSAYPEGYFVPLDARRIDLANPPAKPVAIFTLTGKKISTAGNITAVTAQAKAGKSAAIGAMLAAVAANGTPVSDCLGFEAHPHNGKAVILFDTEQSRYDSPQTRGGEGSKASRGRAIPSELQALQPCGTFLRKHAAPYLPSADMERASKRECGGIHCVIIDGVADLCIDPNDSEEAFEFVEELLRLAVKYDCPLVVVLHENPSQQPGNSKSRGHLGSHLERKAESNLRVVKVGEVSVIFSEKCRNANIPQNRGVQFAWSDEAGMHVTISASSIVDAKAAKKRAQEQPLCNAVFEGVAGSLKYGELTQRLESIAKLKERTAERRIFTWCEIGLIGQPFPEAGYTKL